MRFNTVLTFILVFLTAIVAAMNGCSDIHLQGVIPNPKTISVRIKNYCPHAGVDTSNNPITNTFGDIFAVNMSAAILPEGFAPSLARDGLGDLFKTNPANQTQFNISYRKLDTNNDGFSDLLMVYLGIPATSQPTLPFCDRSASPFPDFDGDGLNDCEEALLGTDPKNPDTDKDGIPDYLEVRFGLNPTSATDALLSPDGDGITNYQKVKQNLPIGTYADATVTPRSLKYDIQDLNPVSNSSPPANPPANPPTESPDCYDLKVSHIPIMTWTETNLTAAVTANEILIQILETAPSQNSSLYWVKVMVNQDVADQSGFLVDGQTQMGQTIGDETNTPLQKDDGS